MVGKANYVVSGDKDLISVEEFIITPVKLGEALKGKV